MINRPNPQHRQEQHQQKRELERKPNHQGERILCAYSTEFHGTILNTHHAKSIKVP
jgi:hypothetical protein